MSSNVIIPSGFSSFELVPCLSDLHAEQLGEPTFLREMLSKSLLIITMAASALLVPEEGKKTEIR